MYADKGKYRKEIIKKFEKKFNGELTNKHGVFESRLNNSAANYYLCENDRIVSGWEEQAYVGYRIWDNSFMNGIKLAGTKPADTIPVFINNVRKILNHKASAMQVASINVSVELDSADPERRKTAMALEKILQFWTKRLRLKRKLDEPNQHSLFVGEGALYYYWDTLNRSENAITGKPTFEPVTPFDKFRDSRTRRKDKSDSRYEFIVKHSTVQEVEDLYGIDIDALESSRISNNETDPDLYTHATDRDSNVDIVIMQEKVKYYYKAVTVHYKYDDTKWLVDYNSFEKDIITPNMGLIADRYNVSIEDVTDEMIWLQLGVEGKNGLLEDGLVAYPPQDTKFTGVFEFAFIPYYTELLETGKYVGKDFTLITINCEYIPTSAYSFGHAYFERDMLRVASLLLTSIVIQTTRSNKLIPIIAPSALTNHEDYIKHIGDDNTIPEINPNWRPAYPGEKPIYWLKPPELSQVITQFADKFLNSIEDNMMSPDVARGANRDERSGRAVIAEQNAAAAGSRSDFLSLEEGIVKIMYRMAEDISRYSDYEHSMVVRGDGGELTNIHINANEETTREIEEQNEQPEEGQDATPATPNQDKIKKNIALTVPFSDVFDDLIITVRVDDSEETKKMMEAQAMTSLLERGIAVDPKDVIESTPNLKDPQKIYENYLRNNPVVAVSKQISEMPPEAQQKIFELAQQTDQQRAQQSEGAPE